MVKFAYNNSHHCSTSYAPLELNCIYNPQTSSKKEVNIYSHSKIVVKLTYELKKLITFYEEEFQYI